MADLTFSVQLAPQTDEGKMPNFIEPATPGQLSPSVNLSISATPNDDLLQPSTGTATQTVEWTWKTNTSKDPNDWRGKTYPVAMVFGMRAIEVAKGQKVPKKPNVSPSSLFTLPTGSGQLVESTINWADDSKEGWPKSKGIIRESSLTYLIPPKTTSWSVNVTPTNWIQIKKSKLAISYADSTKPKKRLALVLKYRFYCFTATFGLWYVDPEFDLCPK